MTPQIRLRPDFLRHSGGSEGTFRHLFNFGRIWKTATIVMLLVALIPLGTITVIDHRFSREAVVAEILQRTSNFVSNTWRTVYFILSEHRLTLDIIVAEHSYDELCDSARLAEIHRSMTQWLGGCTDLSVIDGSGHQVTYVGPYNLEGREYGNQGWFRQVEDRGVYISDVFLGFRNVPHMVIAVRKELESGGFFVLRASLDTERFTNLLSQLEVSPRGDAFLVNHEGVLQTPSRFHGQILEHLEIPVPEYHEGAEVTRMKNARGDPIIVGHAYIPETPFVQMVVKDEDELMEPWYRSRRQVFLILTVSVIIILLVVFGVSTSLVGNMYEADKRRLMALHQAEYSDKMASIGRLAAGVAHEVNNPLAIINEKAGLVKDLFEIEKRYESDPRLIELIDSVLRSVEQCGSITKVLLSFSRQDELSLHMLSVGGVIWDVLTLLNKEAKRRSIDVRFTVAEDVPRFMSDRGKLQQIFVNLINNALNAMEQGGHLDIAVERAGVDTVRVTVSDDGCGIPPEHLDHIFEPFFSTRSEQGGTGLGLSITYGLVRKLGGTIDVDSEVGRGTKFMITLPLTAEAEETESHAHTSG